MPQKDDQRGLPEKLGILNELALDLRWNASRFVCAVWESLDPEIWAKTQNPRLILQHAPLERFERLANDPQFCERLDAWRSRHAAYFAAPTWLDRQHPEAVKSIAYFSMEFMLAESLPIYSGGLGNVAGDQLKSASDLGVPVVGVGLLYQQGYFRQSIAPDGSQREAFPFNEPGTLQVAPARTPDGHWPSIRLPLPGRTLHLRAWRTSVGRVTLYLLDTNDPLNTPRDRGITANLYAPGEDTRFLQELVLGVGGWSLLEKLGIEVEVCHLNEGHAAFATLARAGSFARAHKTSFEVAFVATRAGNVFTTHTPVEAAFDCFQVPELLAYARPFLEYLNTPIENLLDLGRRAPGDGGPFNMAYLAMRGSRYVNAVSQLHGEVSRELFAHLFPRWPVAEVPVRSITNGIHVGTWDGAATNRFWNRASGDERWSSQLEQASVFVERASDHEIWQFRAEARAALVRSVRARYATQLAENGAPEALIKRVRHLFDPNTLTVGFARRFTSYKRPNLVLWDEERFARLLQNTERPVQFIVAGKAHPKDAHGRAMVQRMARFAMREDLFGKIAFVQDYDMALAQCLTAGIDVWVNNPIRGNEASGTSGMKVLANGGLNLSELDGWWNEAYSPEYGWAIREGESGDAGSAESLYDLLETQVAAQFYDRDDEGIPRQWVARVRSSMSELTARFSSDRTVREYTERAYLPAARGYRARSANGAALAKELHAWGESLRQEWETVRLVPRSMETSAGGPVVHLHAYFGELRAEHLKVELYADAVGPWPRQSVEAERVGPIPGAINGFHFVARVGSERPPEHFSARVIPGRPEVSVPMEAPQVLWV